MSTFAVTGINPPRGAHILGTVLVIIERGRRTCMPFAEYAYAQHTLLLLTLCMLINVCIRRRLQIINYSAPVRFSVLLARYQPVSASDSSLIFRISLASVS